MQDPVGRLVSEGVEHSTGVFTMDSEASRRKLAQLARLEPELMLGKLVQAAVAGKASQVRFRVRRQSLEADIHFPPGPASAKTRGYLKLALAWASYQEPRQLSWSCGSCQEPEASGSCHFVFESRVWEQLRALVTGRRNYHIFLSERTYLCPVPVYLDSVLVNRIPASLFNNASEVLRALPSATGFLAPSLSLFEASSVHIGDQQAARHASDHRGIGQRPVVVEGVPDARLESKSLHSEFQPEPWLPYEAEDVLLCASCENFGTSGWKVLEQWEWRNAQAYLSEIGSPRFTKVDRWVSFRYLSYRQDPCELWPVLDGVLLEMVLLPEGPPGCRVIQAVDGLRVDLDQRRLVQDERFQQFCRHLLEEVERMLQDKKR